MFDSLDEEDAGRIEATQIATPEEASGGKTQIASVPGIEPAPASNSWPAPQSSGISNRVSPKDYYADDSIFSKLFNAFTLITLVVGFFVGMLSGYWLRGFFVALQPAKAPIAQVVISPTPKAEVTPIAQVTAEAEVTPEAPLAADEPIVTDPIVEKPATTPAPAKKSVEKAKPKPPKISTPKISTKDAITRVKVLTLAGKVQVDILMGGGSYKYTSRVAQKPLRLLLDISGMSRNLAKPLITPSTAARPLTKVQVSKLGAETMRVALSFNGKVTPNYNIARTKQGLRVTFLKVVAGGGNR